MGRRKVRSLFLSDVHLGSKKSQPEMVKKVLDKFEFEELYLLGDIFEIPSLKWKESNYGIINTLLHLPCEKIYIPGNHDWQIRKFIKEGNLSLGSIVIANNYIYTSLTGKQILLCHGDEFDGFVKKHPMLYKTGNLLYDLTFKINRPYNWARRVLKKPPKSVSKYWKAKVKKGLAFINDFKSQAFEAIKKYNCDAIMIGHIHTPEITPLEDKMYYNTGDFCESCSFITEEFDGEFVLRYA